MLDLIEQLREKYHGADIALIEKAYNFAKKAHEGQKRASGEDYFIHPCAVAEI